MANQANYLWAPAPVPSIPVRGRAERAPVNRLFFVGRNDYTGTPEGVGPVVAGDRLEGRVAGVGSIVLNVGPAA